MLARSKGFQRSPIHDVTGAVEELVDVQLHPGVLENAHRPVLINFHEHVDVAFCAGLASCHRPEYRGMCNPQPPQLRLVRTKRIENVLEV